MDNVLRVLSEGRSKGVSCPLVLVEDSPSVAGGLDIFHEAASSLDAGEFAVLDLFSDPFGCWPEAATDHSGASASSRVKVHSLRGLWLKSESLGSPPIFYDAVRRALSLAERDADYPGESTSRAPPASPRKILLAVDALDSALSGDPDAALSSVRLLRRLPGVHAVVVKLTPDAHPAWITAELKVAAAAGLVLALPPPDEPSHCWLASLQSWTRKRSGRLATSSRAFKLRSSAAARDWAAPRVEWAPPGHAAQLAGMPTALDSQGRSAAGLDALPGAERGAFAGAAPLFRAPSPATASDSAAAPASGAAVRPGMEEAQTQVLPPMFAGGMRLDLTPEEAEQRKSVALPYEHSGEAEKYATQDWRTYLPAAAGGKDARVGHVLYVRDSDSDADSDEDPDDDLDF
ncbi:hypothetical protein H632_c70p3 [Helicosporidium sp. ATCC 50920]|nr:hypothetical protein H632_c70p3 [Helicosporidium sp. ATCC 50920]|eukprot:KDD76910.1 hypothetical protein H632_c70p3 [Helicosporidium sp. ATCC 50920]